MKKSKKKLKTGPKAKRPKNLARKNKRVAVFLALVILPAVLVGVYIIAQPTDTEEERAPAVITDIKRSTSQPGSGRATPAIYAANFGLGDVYEQVNCVCGRCSKTLANCTCETSKRMKDQVARAKDEGKTHNEILRLMLNRYGRKVLTQKKDPAKRQPPPGTPRPAIFVDPPSYDFGTIPQETVTHSFTVMNKGDKDLVIGKITTSCGCTTAKIDQKIIPPGQKATLEVTFDPLAHDTKGKTTRTVHLETNDPKYPVKDVKIRAFVKKEGQAAEELPSFAYNSAKTLEGYRIATQIPHVLEAVPCYCGCGTQSGHRHLKDCFIKPDGSFDDHGSGCVLCDREAIDVKNWLDQNVPIKEIRARIDEKYKKYGPATKTPPI
jgi:hypothetical protein